MGLLDCAPEQMKLKLMIGNGKTKIDPRTIYLFAQNIQLVQHQKSIVAIDYCLKLLPPERNPKRMDQSH